MTFLQNNWLDFFIKISFGSVLLAQVPYSINQSCFFACGGIVMVQGSTKNANSNDLSYYSNGYSSGKYQTDKINEISSETVLLLEDFSNKNFHFMFAFIIGISTFRNSQNPLLAPADLCAEIHFPSGPRFEFFVRGLNQQSF